MTERSGALQEDALYMSYASIVARSCGEEEEEGGDEEEGGGGGEDEGGASIHVSFISALFLPYKSELMPNTSNPYLT